MTIHRPALFLMGWTSVVLASGCSYLSPSEEPNDNGDSGAANVIVEPVRTANFERTISGIGTCTALPTHKIPITASVEGLVEKILVAEGDRVKPGRELIELDDRLIGKQLAELEHARDEIKASLTLLKTLPREPKQRLAKLKIERAQVAEKLAESVVKHLKPLYERKPKEISEQQFFVAQQDLRDKLLAVKVAMAEHEFLMLKPKPNAVAEMQARITRAEAAVQTVKKRREYLQLKVPAQTSGKPHQWIVNRIACNPGQLLSVGTVAVELVDPSEMFVTVWVPASDTATVRTGDHARVSVTRRVTRPDQREGRGESRTALTGVVAFVGWQASPETGLFPVRVRVSNFDGRLRLGMLVSVVISVGEVKDALAVPDAAVIPSDHGPTVVVVRKGKAVILPVSVGLRRNGLTQVTAKGLQNGDRVITQGGYNLPQGAPVNVKRRPAVAKTSQP